jgi:hypothetical protein
MKRQVSVIVDADGRVVGTQVASEDVPVADSARARLIPGPDQEQHMVKIEMPSRPPSTANELTEYHSTIESELKKASK